MEDDEEKDRSNSF
jgi:hypothetical protein